MKCRQLTNIIRNLDWAPGCQIYRNLSIHEYICLFVLNNSIVCWRVAFRFGFGSQDVTNLSNSTKCSSYHLVDYFEDCIGGRHYFWWHLSFLTHHLGISQSFLVIVCKKFYTESEEEEKLYMLFSIAGFPLCTVVLRAEQHYRQEEKKNRT